jgi:FdhD protein
VIVSSHYYSASGLVQIETPVSAEYHIAVLLNGRPYLSIVCSGSDLDRLAAGHLASEGIIRSEDEIERIEVDEEHRTVNLVTVPGVDVAGRTGGIRTLVSASPGSGRRSGVDIPPRCDRRPIDPRVILSSMKEFLGLSTIYIQTHGVHSGALYDFNGKRMAFFEEIGRHNAVDKLVGMALLGKIPIDEYMLFSTGRVSSEIVIKALQASIPVIVTRAAPTDMAIALARKQNLALINGVKSDGFFVSHGADRIMLP